MHKGLNITIVIILLNIGYVKAQTVIADFTFVDNICINENLNITNTSTNAIKYNWNFCPYVFEDSVDSELATTITNGGRNLGIDFIEIEGIWYALATSWDKHKLFKITFGNGLDKTPTVVDDLGNPESFLNNPNSIGLIEQNGEVYALVHNWGSATLTKVHFTNGIEKNDITAENVYSSYGAVRSKMDIINNGTELKTILINESSSEIEVIDFNNDINSIIQPSDVLVTAPITGVLSPRSIEMVKDNGNWYAFVGSYTNGKITRVDFGPNIMDDISNIQPDVISNIIGSDNLNNIEIINIGGIYELHASTRQGRLYKVKIGDDITIGNINSGAINYATNFVYTQGFSLKIIAFNGIFNGFIFDDLNQNLYRLFDTTNCFASIGFSLGETPIVNFTKDGISPILLTAWGATGNSSSIIKEVTITTNVGPIINLNIGTNKCVTQPVNFSLSTDMTLSTYNWDFGDTNTSTDPNPSHAYLLAGSYEISVNVQSINGCNNLLIDTVTVYEEPNPDYVIPPGTLCMNNSVPFANTTTGETGPAVTWTWDFNGEGSSSEKEPSFTFLTSGNKTVTLTSSIPGCANVTQQTFFIEEAPTTNFSFNNVCNTNETTFTDLTSGSGLTTWSWDFGDGNTSTDQSPTHTYVNPGKYGVTLTVGNNLGCSTSITDTVYNHAIPVVSFTNDLPCSSSPIQFSDQSIVQDAGLVAWEWDFGDGNISTERNPQHTYGQIGDFTVQLKAYSQFGCVDSTDSIIEVIQGPEVGFTWDKGCVGEPTTFNDTTYSGGVPITSWTWLIDNSVLTGQIPQYTFTSPGTYPVQLSVTTSNHCAQTISREIIIEDIPATSFDYLETCDGNAVTFYDTTPATINTWEWRIDGTPATTDSVMVSVLNPGDYSISLVVTSSADCTGTLVRDINIIDSPVASFSASTFYGATPLKVQFDNQSTGANAFLWQFNDANDSTSTDINPEFVYTATGIYDVALIASGGQNCNDTTINKIEVVEPEHAISIDAITLLTDGRIALSLSNLGSITYDENNSKLIFTLDNGTELTEAFRSVLYPQNTLNYVPVLTLGEVGNAKSLCAKWQYSDDQTTEILDENCISLSDNAVIANAYPNPASDFINLSVVLVEEGTVNIKLIDSSGAALLSYSDDSAQQGLNNYTIDTTPYRSGLYIMMIETEKEAKDIKVVIDK